MKWFLNMKIGAKLISGFVFVALIAGVIGIVGYSSLHEVGGVRLAGIRDLLTVNDGQLMVIVGERGLVNHLYTDDKKTAQYDYMDEGFAKIEQTKLDYTSLPKNEEETAMWDRFSQAYDQWLADHNIVVDYARQIDEMTAAGSSESEISAVENQMMQAHFTARESFLVSNDILKEMVALNEELAAQSVNSANVMIIVFALVGVLLAIILGLYISNVISKPVKQMLDTAEKIAEGDLNVEVSYQSRDEVGMLAAAFKKMTAYMNEVMSNIRISAEQVAVGSRQVSASSQALSQGATEQASSVEELTASIEQIAAQTQQNAENAEKANELAGASREDAIIGNDRMKLMLEAMNEINESSANISKIIKVIDDIAFQTNILALNAAVEAARAGQHGKGFAVVAEEVRNLAARSANAAKETTGLIEGSIKKAEGGTKIASETASALNKIVEGVSSAAGLVGQIATASGEQSAGIAQINKAIQQVSEVIQTNSATSEESASASEELSGQADMLKEQVARFRLKNASYGAYQEGLAGTEEKEVKNKSKVQELRKHPEELRIRLGDEDMGKYAS